MMKGTANGSDMESRAADRAVDELPAKAGKLAAARCGPPTATSPRSV